LEYVKEQLDCFIVEESHLHYIFSWYNGFCDKNRQKGGILIKEEIRKFRQFIKNRKIHAISYMKNDDASIDDRIAEEIYALSGYVWKWVFILSFLLELAGGLFRGEIGILNVIGMILSSFLWATLFYVAVILLGRSSLELRGKTIRAWQEIKKAFE